MDEKRRQRGVGLLEVIIAMAILLIGLLGVLSLNGMGVRLNGDARRVTRATALARDLMSQVELWDYEDARLALGDHTEAELTADNFFGIPGDVEANSPRALYGSNYRRAWTVTAAPTLVTGQPAAGKSVSVTVSWSNGTGKANAQGTSSAVFFMVRAAPAGARL